MKSSVDFASLLAPDNPRPARLTILQPKELYDPHQKTATGTKNKNKSSNNKNNNNQNNEITNGANNESKDAEPKDDTTMNQLIRKLVSKTKTFQHVIPEGDEDDEDDEFSKISQMVKKMNNQIRNQEEYLSPLFHELSQCNWEQNIQWEGMKDTDDKKKRGEEKTKIDGSTPDDLVSSAAIELLSEPRNPDLDTLGFHISGNIDWEGTGSRYDSSSKNFDNIPLLLEMGTAGQSIARHVIPVSRPIPFDQTEAYLRRHLYKNANITSTAELSKSMGSLTENKLEKAKLIAERQRKRAQMAKDKTTRVTDAMDTLQMGPGKGRTITSSLMGPGGTERTGRPSRASGNTAHHDAEYVEQLPLVFNHVLSNSELTVVEQRQYHRPKLPRSFCKSWQCQIRFVPNATKNKNVTATDRTFLSLSSNQQQRIRTEADLNPTEGNLVLLEYCEERPPIQLTKGMASKIVNYFRGDKSRCPVSAGGGDRPTRRKRRTEGTNNQEEQANLARNTTTTSGMERPPRLQGLNPNTTNVKDWIGKIPKPSLKSKEDASASNKPAIDVLPEGVTEILHPKVHGPFLGEVEEGITQTGLINNLFSAPMFRHEPDSTDFLMVLGKRPIAATGDKHVSTSSSSRMSVVLRDLPQNIYTVGQVEPRLGGLVHSPQTTGERNFLTNFVSYHIAKNLQWYERHHGRGLRFDEITSMWASSGIQNNSLRQRIKAVAVYDKNTQIWESKSISDLEDDYPGVEALGRRIAPEGVATYETACAAQRRLQDRGIVSLYVGSGAPVQAVKIVSDYLARQKNAALELRRKMKKAVERAKLPQKNTKDSKNMSQEHQQLQIQLYEKAFQMLDEQSKELKRKHEVAEFIYQELCLAPWHLTFEFIDVHKQHHGTGQLELQGKADPSGGQGGYSFLRDTEKTKASSTSNSNSSSDAIQKSLIKKITGTDNDLRKLTMKQMGNILKSFGMPAAKIETLKRWDRVHVIRDYSTKAASDGMDDGENGVGLSRFARGEKLKLSEQKEDYQKRIQEIWRRQRTALASDLKNVGADDLPGGMPSSNPNDEAPNTTSSNSPNSKKAVAQPISDDDNSDDDDDDDFANALMENMEDDKRGTQLLNNNNNDGGGEDMANDARDFAALRRKKEENMDMKGTGPTSMASTPSLLGKKVVRQKITKTFPTGKQITTFRFLLAPDELTRVEEKKRQNPSVKKKKNREHKQNDRALFGHAMFEDDDNYELQIDTSHLLRRGNKGGRKGGRLTPKGGGIRGPRANAAKLPRSKQDRRRINKRKKEMEEADLYVPPSKRNNNPHRSRSRSLLPHVIFSTRLEQIRQDVERFPSSGPFVRPVDRRRFPQYYEKISDPIDLQTIRDKNSKNKYKTADSFVKDFLLMKTNAEKFNGVSNPLALEANRIYEYVKQVVDKDRDELTQMEMAVQNMTSTTTGRRTPKNSASEAAQQQTTVIDGMAVGDLSKFSDDSDSDDSGELVEIG